MIPSLKEQTVIVIKAPPETKLEVPHPEEVCHSTYDEFTFLFFNLSLFSLEPWLWFQLCLKCTYLNSSRNRSCKVYWKSLFTCLVFQKLQVHLRSTRGPIDVFTCSDPPKPSVGRDVPVANNSRSKLSTSRNDSVPVSPDSSFAKVSSKGESSTSRSCGPSHWTATENTHEPLPILGTFL